MKNHNEVKEAIIEFLKANGKRPSKKGLDSTEKKLASSLNNYTCQTSKAFDEGFRATVNDICPPTRKGRQPKLKVEEVTTSGDVM